MWTQLPPEKKGTSTHSPTQFLAHVYGQMTGWMKTPLGTDVDLCPGHTVLDRVPAPAKGTQQPPSFRPCLLWPRSPISATAELLYKRSLKTGSPYAAGPFSCLSLLSVLSVTLVHCGQTVGWIKIPLQLSIGLGPGDIVLDGDPGPAPLFSGRTPILGA